MLGNYLGNNMVISLLWQILVPFLSVDLREVKEIRVGKNSKDFEKWPDDAKRMENMKCFVVFYGLEFRLKTLSVAGDNDV